MLQGGRAVTIKLKHNAWETTRLLLDQEITAISEKILTTPLKFAGNHTIGKKKHYHQAFAAVTKQWWHDFEENEAEARSFSTHKWFVTMA